MGCAINLTESDQVKIHSEVYEQAKQELPADDFNEMTGAVPFRRDVAENPWHFAEQLPFYSIRPLYIELLAIVHRCGLTYIQATRLVSALSLAVLGILVFLWIKTYVETWRAGLVSGLMLLTSPIFLAGRTGSPDALSGMVVVLALYLLIEKERLFAGILLFFCSLFIRSDNVIMVGLILAYYGFSRRGSIRLDPRKVICLLLLAGVSMVAISHFSGNYGWAVLMKNTFTDAIPNPGEQIVTISRSDYLEDAKEIGGATAEGTLLVFIFLGTLTLLSARIAKQTREGIGLVLAAIMVRLLLFPHLEDRYFVAPYAIIAVAAAITFVPTISPDISEKFRA